MPPELVGQVAGLLEQHASAAIATLATRISSVAQLLDPGIVKVVTDPQGRALYFSRAPIPWNRDTAPASIVSQRSFAGARRHVGLYAYRVSALQRMSMLQPGQLEQIERLEQLRALENGLEVRVGDAVAYPGPSVDSQEDLARVAVLMNRAEARHTVNFLGFDFSQLNVGDVTHAMQLALGPVFLLNGIGVLLAMMTARLARIVDRARAHGSAPAVGR